MNWKEIDELIEAYFQFGFKVYVFLLSIGLIGGAIFIMFIHPIYSYFHIDEEVRFKCFKYISHEHCDYPLFKDLKNLKGFYENHPELCTDKKEISQSNGMEVKQETIVVALLENEVDSLFVKVEYREFLIKRDYYTLKCFINKYAPEDFTF